MSVKAKKGHVGRNILLVIFIVIFLVSAGILINELLIKPYKNTEIMIEAQQLYNPEKEDPIEALKAVNPDVVGFITVPNTVIDYPVVMPTKDEGEHYYLTHNYKKEYSAYGSIFVDISCPEGLQSKNVMLHGHNMNNGSMFAAILKYGDLAFYRQSPTIQFDNSEWKVFAINKLNVLESQGEPFGYLQCGFASDEDFLNYIYNVRVRSLINTPVNINEDDQIMLMSTCSYEYEDFRTVVYARRTRAGESTEVNTSAAYANPNALMPDIYYTGHSVAKPTVTEFSSALAAGDISWYDGKKH